MLNAQTRMIPNTPFSVTIANKARIEVVRSPYAAGRAKATGRSGDTTPGITKAKPTNRKVCKRSNGRRASVRGTRRSAGQMYRLAMISHEMKLRITLIPNIARSGIIDSVRRRQSVIDSVSAPRGPQTRKFVDFVLGGISGLLLYRALLHEGEFPNMSVEVLKSVTIHKTVVLRLVEGCASSSTRLANHFIDFTPTGRRQTHQDLSILGCVANFSWCECFEFWVSQQHHVNVVAHDHASCSVVGELRVKAEPQLGKELHGCLEVFHRQIHENVFCRHFPLLCESEMNSSTGVLDGKIASPACRRLECIGCNYYSLRLHHLKVIGGALIDTGRC